MLDTHRCDLWSGALRHLAWISLSVGLLCLAGCQTLPVDQPGALRPSRVLPLEAASEKTVRYEILPDLSDVRFLVFRAGPLAKLGHNHVVQGFCRINASLQDGLCYWS